MTRQTAPTLMLATDLDGTMIPLADTPAGTMGIAEFTATVRKRDDILLVYVTGRHLELALAGVRVHGLPAPEVLCCDVGTRLYRRSGEGAYLEDETYASRMRGAFGSHDGDHIRRVLADMADLELQEDAKQGRFKVSYYLDTGIATNVVERVGGRLAGLGIEHHTIYSVDVHSGTGLLDVLPAKVSKATPLGYLQEATGISLDDVVFAGDSGNDLAALTSGVRAILVGNAPAAVKQETRRAAEAAGVSSRLYVAQSPLAAGVLEGCRHFGVL